MLAGLPKNLESLKIWKNMEFDNLAKKRNGKA